MSTIKTLSIEEAIAAAQNAALNVVLTEDGTIVIESKRAFPLVEIPATDARLRLQSLLGRNESSADVVVIGRESIPPLRSRRASRCFGEIVNHSRCFQLSSVAKLIEIIAYALSQGTSVNNDFYFFTTTGEYLGYVSHHDEVLLWAKLLQS